MVIITIDTNKTEKKTYARIRLMIVRTKAARVFMLAMANVYDPICHINGNKKQSIGV